MTTERLTDYKFEKAKSINYVGYKIANYKTTSTNELFTFIDTERPNKIVLDLRYNNGGNSGI